MDELKIQLAEKLAQLRLLNKEVIELEAKIKNEKWKDVPECLNNYYQVRGGECAFGQVYNGSVYCKNPNCHN